MAITAYTSRQYSSTIKVSMKDVADRIDENSELPAFGNCVSRFIGRSSLKILGWKTVGQLPNVPKVMTIAFPHTSNWDFVTGLSVMLATGLKASWIAKAEMFKSPLGGLWKKLGGIPIDRKKKVGVVDQQIEAVNAADQIFLLIAPEGTRSRVETWKTGFYHIAVGANIPILPVTWDYSRKIIEFQPLFYPKGNVESDIKELMQMAKNCVARFPDKAPWQKN